MESFKCRICQNTGGGYLSILETETPLAAGVTDYPSKALARFPLHVVKCSHCGHVQLMETLDASFYGEYLYTPSYASGFVEYIDKFVERLNDIIKKPDRKVMEVGSSNGYLLDKLQKTGWTVLGIEPSKKLSRTANDNGINTYNAFFSKETVCEIKKQMNNPDVIIFRHVLEHLDNLGDIVKAIKKIMGEGLLLIEVPYLKRIVAEDQFYAFFHEHLSYYSVTALNNLLLRENIYIHKVYENDLEGGSILIVADSDQSEQEGDNIKQYIIDERETLSKPSIEAFAKRVSGSVEKIKKLVNGAKNCGQTVAAWGAGQRGCTLISMCGFQSSDIKYVIDVNENYWNKYAPGTDIQIVPPSYYKDNHVDKMLVFATGYAKSIMEENQAYKDRGGEFIEII